MFNNRHPTHHPTPQFPHRLCQWPSAVAKPGAAALYELAGAVASKVCDGPRSALRGRAPVHFQVCSHLTTHGPPQKFKQPLGLRDVRRFPALPGVRTTLHGIEELCTANYATLSTHHRARNTPHKGSMYLSRLPAKKNRQAALLTIGGRGAAGSASPNGQSTRWRARSSPWGSSPLTA